MVECEWAADKGPRSLSRVHYAILAPTLALMIFFYGLRTCWLNRTSEENFGSKGYALGALSRNVIARDDGSV